MKKKRKKPVLVPAQEPPHPGKELMLREALLNDPLPGGEFDASNPVEKLLRSLEERRQLAATELSTEELMRQLWGVVCRNERHLDELERRLQNLKGSG